MVLAVLLKILLVLSRKKYEVIETQIKVIYFPKRKHNRNFDVNFHGEENCSSLEGTKATLFCPIKYTKEWNSSFFLGQVFKLP